MAKLPTIKKKITSFLTREEGKISNANLIKAGIVISAFAIAAQVAHAGHSSTHANVPNHTNQLGVQYSSGTVTGTHGHSHASHGSHYSHGSHGSHNSW